MFEKGYKFTVSGALTAALCFFLPMVMVSCGNMASIRVSGWQMAAGMTIGEGYMERKIDGEPIYFIILIAAILLLGLAISFKKSMSLSKARDGVIVFITSVVPLLFLWAKMDDTNQYAMGYGLEMQYQIGFYGISLGFIIAAIGGIVNFRSVSGSGEVNTQTGANQATRSDNPNPLKPTVPNVPVNTNSPDNSVKKPDYYERGKQGGNLDGIPKNEADNAPWFSIDESFKTSAEMQDNCSPDVPSKPSTTENNWFN